MNYETELKFPLDNNKLLGNDLLKEDNYTNAYFKSRFIIVISSPFVNEYNDNSFETLINQLQKKVEPDHKHSPVCGHIQIKHGDHMDYIVNGYLHHPHENHCDFHGEIHMISE